LRSKQETKGVLRASNLSHIYIWAGIGCSPGAPRLEDPEDPSSLGAP